MTFSLPSLPLSLFLISSSLFLRHFKFLLLIIFFSSSNFHYFLDLLRLIYFQVTLLQIAVPSRTDVREYQELKEEMDQLVGRINGCFTTPNWSPIRYIYGCVSQDELAAFYR